MVVDEHPLIIGGAWVAAASSKRFTVINATTEEPIGSVPEAVEADVDRAVAAARQAFDHSGWETSTPAERAARMTRRSAPKTWRAACRPGRSASMAIPLRSARRSGAWRVQLRAKHPVGESPTETKDSGLVA